MDRFVSEGFEKFVYNLSVSLIAVGFLLVHYPQMVEADESYSISLAESEREVERFSRMYESSRPTAQELLEKELASLDLPELPDEIVIPSLEDYRGRTEPLEPEELVELLSLIGFRGDGLRSGWAIAMNESTGDPTAHNTNVSTGDNSYGLFQINMIGRMGPQRREAYGLDSNAELFDPVLNAEIAFEISKGGTDFGDWRVGPNAYRGDGSPVGYTRWLAEYPGGM